MTVTPNSVVTVQRPVGRQSRGDQRRGEERDRLQGGDHLRVGAMEDRELRALLLSPFRCLHDRHLELVPSPSSRPLSSIFSIPGPLFFRCYYRRSRRLQDRHLELVRIAFPNLDPSFSAFLIQDPLPLLCFLDSTGQHFRLFLEPPVAKFVLRISSHASCRHINLKTLL
ncbi:hypothetical protein B296_00036392 [Ensete ventricosum]|uniref:Uncharacterized protein n=1 Tax=Ensete ventricosum TaxID=4639 RepID=A0A426ZG23_ENSVE|nr:hypothetical protein B296_00036392 [Ensete ventricosum]